ncbi:HD domain-containing protein [Photobacterium minamisatsumaniensis]|uniref:HD domain-containing protein n=1 Tax=Photobacterium minamisatsumaniensis TaxID=2910233 RepID=UPI003D134967
MTELVLSQLENQLQTFISELSITDPAHDLSHIKRVVTAAKQFAHHEKAELAVIIPAAWLHDCVTLAKNHPNRHKASSLAAEKALAFLSSIDYPVQYYAGIVHAIEAHSFSANIPVRTLEAAIVQDADRIDALGAIGIARCIQVSTSFNSALYSTADPFGHSRERNDKAFCLDHFYIKLFQLEKTMNTEAAKQEARQRTEYMKGFLNQLGHEIGEVNQT